MFKVTYRSRLWPEGTTAVWTAQTRECLLWVTLSQGWTSLQILSVEEVYQCPDW